MKNLWLAFLFFLPAGLSNMAPVLGNKIPGIKDWRPSMDFGKSYRGQRIFGDNKSWRGLISGGIVGALTSWLVFPHTDLSLDSGNYILLGAALGVGALVGDAVESFFKRQAKVKPGSSWFPWDQLDYIIGGILFSLPFVVLSLSHYLFIFILYFGLHLLVSYVGYLLKFKDKPI